MPDPKIKRAIISLTDKSGIEDFARALVDEFGVEIVSTGGTAKVLEQAGIPVVAIDELTGFPEMMDGRVKTLHPKVHGGLLARRDLASHMKDAEDNGIGMIDMVVVNLYAFEATIAKPDVDYQDAVEHIDIGGPSMLRSAAKNHASVTVVTNPAMYDAILFEMRNNDGATTLKTRKDLALEVFRLTSAYDNAIYSWLHNELVEEGPFWEDERVVLHKEADLRYGENPHQHAAFYKRKRVGVSGLPLRPTSTPSLRPSSCRARSSATTITSTPMPRGLPCASSTWACPPASSSSISRRAASPAEKPCWKPTRMHGRATP